MIEQCRARPLVMNLSLHPYIFGQPFRLHGLRRALAHCAQHASRDRVSWTRPCEIAHYCYELAPGIIPGS